MAAAQHYNLSQDLAVEVVCLVEQEQEQEPKEEGSSEVQAKEARLQVDYLEVEEWEEIKLLVDCLEVVAEQLEVWEQAKLMVVVSLEEELECSHKVLVDYLEEQVLLK